MGHIHLNLGSDDLHPLAKDSVVLSQIGHTIVSTLKMLINAHNSILVVTQCSPMTVFLV